jgi:futalosine hydrolase
MNEALNPILFCAATPEELEATGVRGPFAVVTGTGTPTTLLRLIPLLERVRPSLIVNTGIAGAYAGSELEIGDVVVGTSEVFADLGMEFPDGENFRPLADFPFADETLRAPLPLMVPPGWAGRELKRGRGATVNMCAGTDETGARRRRLFGVDFESMEGAAAALAGRDRGIPVIEVRAISTIAARREGTRLQPGNIRRALEALALFWAAHRESLPGSSV